MAAGERERELQRKLTQAALQAEAALEGCHMAASAESDHMVKNLIQQRDTANDALLVCACLLVCATLSAMLGMYIVVHVCNMVVCALSHEVLAVLDVICSVLGVNSCSCDILCIVM